MRTPIWIHRRKYPTESISYNIVADENGNIYLPVWWYNRSSSSRNASYDWMVSIDDGTPVNYSWTWSAGGSITFSGYQVWSEHSITITPVTEAYWWALAYWWHETAGAPYLTRVNYDWSYVGYGSSATSTGNYFRYAQYRWCSSLVFVPDEVLPNWVTSISTYSFRWYQYYWCTSLVAAADEVLPEWVTSVGYSFRYSQYQWCSSLVTAPDEVIPSTVTSVGSSFRFSQYRWCTSLVNAPDEVLPEWVTSIVGDFRREQYYGCTSLVAAPNEVVPDTVTSIGNQFRYTQYRWCTSLVSAPDEVLPNWITSIGSNFRREQYYQCTSLVTAPDEAMPNTVTNIDGVFRYRQYYWCTSLTSAKLIANNIVSTSNKRGDQFSGAWSTTNPMVITIYWNEMEADMATNSCWLANANVSFIYVQPNLVEQYQQAAIRSNIDDVKFWPLEEIVYKMIADDNGNLYVPVGGYSASWSTNAAYNWNVAVDWGNATNYSWTWSSWGSVTLSWYTPWTNHTIKITPTNVAYLWARAYWWYNTVWAPYLTEVFYDWSYVGYGSGATSTGGSFRNRQYQWCSSLISAPDEVLPSSVTSIGGYFRQGQYYWCTSLITAPDEVMSGSVTSIDVSFRAGQYSGCTSLVTASNEAMSNWITSIGGSFRQSQYYWCTSLTTAPDEVFPSWIDSVWYYFRWYQYQNCSSLISVPNETIPNTVTSIGDYFRYQQYYQCGAVVSTWVESIPDTLTSIWNDFRYRQYSTCTSLTTVSWRKDPVVNSVGNRYRNSQFYWMLNNELTITVLSDVWPEGGSNTLYDNSVLSVQVPSAYLQNYIDATTLPRSNITDSKFVWY